MLVNRNVATTEQSRADTHNCRKNDILNMANKEKTAAIKARWKFELSSSCMRFFFIVHSRTNFMLRESIVKAFRNKIKIAIRYLH